MSWVDDIRCLYCDGRLPLYKKITDGQFCSAAHRKAYWQEHERLAVERLLKTHDTLRAYRPPGAVEAILGPTPAPEPERELDVPEMLQCLSLPLHAKSGTSPEILAADPVEYETGLEAEPPSWSPRPEETPQIAAADALPIEAPTCPRWLPDSLGTAAPEPVAAPPASVFPASAGILRESMVEAVPLSHCFAPVEWTPVAGDRIEPIDSRVHPVYDVDLRLLPLTETSHASHDEVPRSETLHAIPVPEASAMAHVRMEDAANLTPLSNVPPQFPASAASLSAAPAPATLSQIPLDRSGWTYDNLGAVNVESGALDAGTEMPHQPPSIPVHRPRLLLSVAKKSAKPAAVATRPTEPPKEKVMAAVAATAPQNTQLPVPNPTGLLPLTPAAGHANLTISHAAPTLPQPLQTELMRPMSKLEPLDEKPVADMVPPSAVVTSSSSASSLPKAHVWTHAVDFWKHAPRDLKTLVFAIPVLLGLALHPTLPKVRVTAPSTGGIQRNFQKALNSQLVNVRQSMVDRAAVALDDDFRAGLDEWSSRGDATTEWSFDATGFVRPGPLALYRPSVGLGDYQMQFLGLIDKKALSWVVRAADFDNYYVVKLVVLKPGPVPTIGLTRYAVVNGKPDSRVDTPVPIDARNDMLYRVRLDVHGDDFSLAVQGQMIDSWSEPRLRHGGVGFFTARDEASRVRWLQVTHQYDMLGRLCAYLAPYNVSTTNGSWPQ